MSRAERLTIEEPKAASNRVVRPVCQIARAQAPCQACLRPAMWVPGLRNLHMARETWLIKMDPAQALDKLVDGVEDYDKAELMEVHKVDKSRGYVEIFQFTQGCNWLDVVEVRFYTGDEPGMTRAESVSFSSGLIPAWCPLSFLCNCCCFFAPFSGNGQNTKRLEVIRNALGVEVTVTAETKCNCCPS
ncbi:uncharacterized protein LOC135341559 isoform X2 [Halichondria panicea]|uniref:uncharacterized protein LOC135341559 isoform X2 n=1 Tax=Halichondria panicea TaxID=6063 RepID=UPI00312B551E